MHNFDEARPGNFAAGVRHTLALGTRLVTYQPRRCATLRPRHSSARFLHAEQRLDEVLQLQSRQSYRSVQRPDIQWLGVGF
jgi:hypothetical protein